MASCTPAVSNVGQAAGRGRIVTGKMVLAWLFHWWITE
jgi:hypothetical protein